MDWDILPLRPFIGFAIWLFRMIKPNFDKSYNFGRGIYVYFTIDGLAGDGYLAISKKYIRIINRI